ncbi:MAG: hypothetical protein ACLTEH_06155 [Clostridia bacterium]
MEYYIDLGSSTIKTYLCKEKSIQPQLIEEKSILFKDYFTQENGISHKNYILLLSYFKDLTTRYTLSIGNCKMYATGIWRKIPKEQLEVLKADFAELNLKFHVISQEEENYYFEKAMQGIYDRKRVLMVNMGGKTTELVVFDKGNVIERKNLSIGVAEIMNNFPEINDENQSLKIEDILKYALNILKEENLEWNCDCGIFTGGELRYQQLVKYHLVPNCIFHDGIHEFMISYEDFAKKNQEILEQMTLDDLYILMPHNQKWMDGAKAGSILAQAIFLKAKVPYIIPSDLNIINGIVKLERK